MQPSPSPADQSIARYLLPRLVKFLVDTTPEDPEDARRLVAHTLTQYVSAVGPDRAQIAMSVVVPALLSRATSEGSKGGAVAAAVYKETSTRLLEMASINQAAFRGVVGAMSEGQKAFMEEVIRSRQVASAGNKGEESEGKPTIALKMNFGEVPTTSESEEDEEEE